MAPAAGFKDEVMAPPEVAKAGLSLSSLMIAVVVAVLLSVSMAGGLVFWMARSGRLPGRGGSGAAAAAEPAAAAAVVVAKTHPMVLEPILANLADAGGAAYLRVSITLRVVDAPIVKGEKPKEAEKGAPVVDVENAEVRDTVLEVIGRMTSQELLVTDGKDKLKRVLTAAIVQHVPEVKIAGVYFTEFLVQQ
jgi:flagellar FliL protein